MKLDAKETLLIKAEEIGPLEPPAVKKANKLLNDFLIEMEQAGVFTREIRNSFEEMLTGYASAHFDAGMSLGFDAGKAAMFELITDQPVKR
ncbi:MAG: hypothetical protein ACOX6Y_09525 [Christensenellales bacterium]|jgi:hypothetical protein